MNGGRDVEVVIAGGGPAGATTALLLARAGRQVVVVERAPMPRDKVCGDLLGTEAVRRLRALNAGADVLAGGFALDGAVLHAPRGPAYGAGPRPPDALRAGPSLARVVPRRVLDGALLGEAKAGGAYVVYARVTGLLRDTAGRARGLATTAGDVRATVVVGADGWGSAVGRALGNVKPQGARAAIAARCYASGIRGLDRRMHFFINRSGDGYGWIFPLGEGIANVGLGFICDEPGSERLRAAFENFRGPSSSAAAYLGAAIYSDIAAWPIPLGWSGAAVAAPGVLLAGDAAALASPLSGSGIHHALASGEEAARAALATLHGDAGAWRRYSVRLARRFAPRLHAEAWFHRTCARAERVERWASFTRLPGGAALLSRAMLALG